MTVARPIVPEDLHRASRSLERACFAAIRARVLNRNPTQVCRELYPHDRQAAELAEQRAAISGATTTQAGWAAELVQTAVLGFLTGLPTSAAGQLIAAGTSVPLEGRGSVKIPGIAAGTPTPAAWVGEGGAIPVRQEPLVGNPLGPARKMAVLLSMTGELARNSAAEAVFRQLLDAIAAVSLDAAYFSSAGPTDDVMHQGLLYNVSPIAVTGAAEMIDVLAALAAAVGAGGSGQVVFVTGPGRASVAALRSREFTATVLPSLAVPEDQIIAIDPVALVHAAGLPDISASNAPVIHSADPAGQISAPGSPNVVAAPTLSAFQTDQIVLRLLLPIAFAKLRSGAVAYADELT